MDILKFAAKEKLEIVLFASASRRGGRKGGSGGIPPAEPIGHKISSDFFKYTPPVNSRVAGSIKAFKPGVNLPKQKRPGVPIMRKTWKQKIEDNENFPKVLKLESKLPCFKSLSKTGVKIGDPIVLVNASEIIPLMAKVPQGKLITIREICQKIAQNHKVKGCCSLTTGILIMAIANAAEEDVMVGKKTALARIPYWRTLKSDGFLNEKYPGGLENHMTRLEGEGYKITRRGKKYQVADFERYLLR